MKVQNLELEVFLELNGHGLNDFKSLKLKRETPELEVKLKYIEDKSNDLKQKDKEIAIYIDFRVLCCDSFLEFKCSNFIF